MQRRSALIVSADSRFNNSAKRILVELKCSVDIESNALIDPSRLDFSKYALVIAGEGIRSSDGQSIFIAVRKNAPEIPVIVIAKQSDVRQAVSAIQNGAFDYFSIMSDERLIRESLARALDLANRDKKEMAHQAAPSETRSIVTCSSNMKEMLAIAKRVAISNATVLIQGESGTGKELIGRFIHEQSKRSNKPFVAMNCAALPENLAESELFGYEKGAFTGATSHRKGKFLLANGGTLMLDEISEMPLSLQVKLLRVLQEKEVDPIGARSTVPVDVRVIATSNRDLGKMVTSGTFRQDLYFRLRVIPLSIPPLRDRKEDIPLLVQFFADRFKLTYRKETIQFSDDALDQLSGWPWPGNVRELENTIERALLICDQQRITPKHLLLDHDISAGEQDGNSAMVGMTVKEMEKKLIGQTLKHVNDNRTHAAKMLGISIRTLRNKLREYGTAALSPVHTAHGQ